MQMGHQFLLLPFLLERTQTFGVRGHQGQLQVA